jgi:hypothetical protein
MKLYNYLFFSLLVHSTTLLAQNKTNNIIPPSPTAAALAKYGDIPVSTYTGIPNISIPIYDVRIKSLSVPVSLNFHASGVKVEEDASWSGLGWSVTAGGAISRSVRGGDDLSLEGTTVRYPDYILPVSADANNNYLAPPNNFNDLAFFSSVYSGARDADPDVFYFNFGGHSGKFFIKQRPTTNSPYIFEIESVEKLKIALNPPNSMSTGYSWTITTENGVKYQFGTEEKTKTSNASNDVIEPAPKLDYSPADPDPKTITTSWYLDKITAPDGNVIDLIYSSPSVTGSRKPISYNEDRSYPLKTEIISTTNSNCLPSGGAPPDHHYNTSLSIVYDIYLKEIRFKNGKVRFLSSDRLDVQPVNASVAMPQKLDQIIVSETSSNGDVIRDIKKFQFAYSYFTNYDPSLGYSYRTYTYSYPNTYSGKRLKLNSLTESNGNTVNPPYLFEYYTSPYFYGDIPDKYSKSRDSWGFFNNASNTITIDPQTANGYTSTTIPPYLDLGSNNYYTGADRAPNEDFIKLGMLKDIKYPTGGETDFEFEMNDYSKPPVTIQEQYDYQTNKRHVQLDISGELVQDPDNPNGVSTIDITLSTPTVIKTRVFCAFDSHFNCEAISIAPIYIRSTGNTPFFAHGQVLNLGCNGESDEASDVVVVPPGTYKISVYATGHLQTTGLIDWNEVTSQQREVSIQQPFGYQKNKRHVRLDTYGELVQNPDNPNAVSSIDITLSTTTVIKTQADCSYDDDFDCSNSGVVPIVPIYIRSTGSTPFFAHGLMLNVDCYGQTGQSKDYVVVPPGTYKISANAIGHLETTGSIDWDEETTQLQYTKTGGGLRIKKITDHDGIDHANDRIRRFQYTYIDPDGIEKSSGIQMSPLYYAYNYQFFGSDVCPGVSGNGQVNYKTNFLKRTSESNVSLGNSAQGNPVGYSVVTILNGENGENGKTVYTYQNQPDQLSAPFFPNIPNQPSPGNGSLISQAEYKVVANSTGNTFQKVKETVNQYTNEQSLYQTTKGMRCYGCEYIQQNQQAGVYYTPTVKFYDNTSEWWHKTSETSTMYDINGVNPVTQTVNYFYDNPVHLQLTRTQTVKSNGKTITSLNTYPEDYHTGTPFIDDMKNNFEMGMPIEQVTYQDDASGTKIIGGAITEYLPGGKGQVGKIFKVETDIPISLSAYNFSNMGTGLLPYNNPASSSIYNKDGHYTEQMAFDHYDNNGNLLMLTPKDGIPVSYLWGYNGQYPIAECKNAGNTEFYYEGFESMAGAASGGHTGSKHGTNANVNWALPNNRPYVISYWYLNNGVWQYSGELPFTGTFTMLGSGYDDIRIYPADAQMTTYTYQPLVGMSSSTDSKGSTIYYEYDDQLRLANIKDKDGNVLKYTDYHYKQ